jgi:hypothetical protein
MHLLDRGETSFHAQLEGDGGERETVYFDETSFPPGQMFQEVSWDWKPTALAPLLGIPLVYYVWPYLQTTQNGWAQIAIIWALAAIVAQSWPSETDWAVALKHPLGLVLWAGFVGWILL